MVLPSVETLSDKAAVRMWQRFDQDLVVAALQATTSICQTFNTASELEGVRGQDIL